MRRISKLLLVFVLSIVVFTTEVFADTKNEVTLNFDGGIIHDGYVEYSKIAKLQIFKDEDLVIDVSNGMKFDLNEAEYRFVVIEIPAEDTGGVVGPAPVKLNINNWYYPMSTTEGETKSTFKLESSKFSGILNIKLERIRTVINTKVENEYSDLKVTGTIDLSKDYVIDFTKEDDITNGLKLFADLDKTLYYKKTDDSLLLTDNEEEAIIKVIGDKLNNRAVVSLINSNDKDSEVFKGTYTKYTGSKLQYIDGEEGIINEIRTDYYVNCDYDYTFIYKVEEKPPVVTPPIEEEPSIENPKTGDNIIVYMILGILSTISIIVLSKKIKEVNE